MNNIRNKLRKSQGFTLIEIMVVLVIIGVMAALIVPRVVGKADDARKIAAKTDITSIMSALNMYKLDNGRYPEEQQGLKALVQKPTVGTIPTNYNVENAYLAKVPNDPWGNAYQYANPGTHGQPIDVFSYGPDGKDSSKSLENSKIIGSWQ